jgi:hypothetical protein
MGDPRPLRLLAGLVFAFAAFIGLFGWSLTAAGHAPALHGVRVAVSGPPAAVDALRRGLDAARPGAIHLVDYPTPDAARRAVTDRAVYAAVSTAPPQLYVASAAGPAVSSALEAAFTRAFASRGGNLAVADLVPLRSGDPRGLAILYVIISCVIGSVAFAVVRSVVLRQPGVPALALSTVAFAALAGLAEAVTADTLTGALGGSFWTLLLGGGLVALAVVAAAGGLLSLLGLPGAGIAALVIVVAGNASSGGASAPEMVDGFWRHLGPYLPPGAGATFTRDVVYFGGRATGGPVAVLALWTAAGLLMTAVGLRPGRHASAGSTPAPEAAAEAPA